MKKNNIPTAEEFFKKYSNLYQFEEGEPEYLVDKEDFKSALIESNKLHVKAALEAAERKSLVHVYGIYDTTIDFKCEDTALTLNDTTVEVHIDKDSILNAYPETNIR